MSAEWKRNRTFHVYNCFTDTEYAIASDSALNAVARVAHEVSGYSYVQREQTVWASATVAIGDYVAFFDGRPILGK